MQRYQFDEKKPEHDNPYKWKISVLKNKRRREMWELFIIILAFYSVWVIPIRFSINPKLFDPVYNALDFSIWLMFVMDSVVSLRTTYIDKEWGKEISDSKLIAINYLKSLRAKIELLALMNLPAAIISSASVTARLVLNALGLLRFVRIFRIQDLIL